MVIRHGSLAHGILVALLFPTLAAAQQSPNQGVGVVTAIQGQATVGRASLPQPAALRFKDDVFFRDEIATRERSTVRLLLGGKGSLTIREQSQVTLDESVMPEGGRRSVLGLLVGKIGAAIARGLMRPGDTFEIRTPNAIASVRGTVLIAEYIPPQGRAAASQPVLLASAAPGPLVAQAPEAGGTSNFFVLSGQVTITPQGQPPVNLGPLQTVSVTATAGGAQVGSVQNLTPAQAAQAAQGLESGKPHTGEAEMGKAAQVQAEMAAAVANTILQATTGQPTTPTAPVESPAVNTPTNNTVAPVTPAPEVPPVGLPAGPLLSFDNVNVRLAADTSLVTFTGGSPNAVTPLSLSGGGTIGVSGSPLVAATGNPISHEGTIVTLTNSAKVMGASTGTSVMVIEGTSLTNNGGSLFTLSGGSEFSGVGNLLNVGAGASLAGSGSVLDASNSQITTVPGFSLVSVNSGGTLGASSTTPLLHLTDSVINSGANLLQVSDPGSSVTLAGPLVANSGSKYFTTNNLVRIRGGGMLVGASSEALINLSGTMFTGGQGPGTDSGGSILNMRTDAGDTAANMMFLTGPLLTAMNGTFNSTDSNFVNIRDNAILASTTTTPFVQLVGSTVTANSNIIRVGPYATNDAGVIVGNGVAPTVVMAGPALKATDTQFIAETGSFITIRDTVNGILTGASPFIQLVGSTAGGTTVTAKNGNFLTLASANNQPPGLTLASAFLDATNTNFTIGDPAVNSNSFLSVRDSAELSSSSTDALVHMGGSTLITAGNFLTVRRSGAFPSMVSLTGPLLNASNSSFTTFNAVTAGGCCSFVFVGEGGQLQGTGLDPLLQITGSSFPNIGGSFVNVTLNSGQNDATPAPGTLILAGPLLNDSGSTFGSAATPVAGSLLRVMDGSMLKSTTTSPLMNFNSSTVYADSLLFLRGRGDAAHLDASGLGTDVPLTTGGTILELDPTTVTLSGTGNAIRVDTATLNALGPIINMISSTLTTSLNGPGLMNVFKSNVTSVEVMKLDNSILTVKNGPLLSVTGGSQMTVNADFTTLTNNSRITVANGPLIAADGAGTKLWITGNLLNFLTASGNQVVVTNSIAPNMSGNSVDGVTAKGNVVFAGDTPVIKNLSSNSVPSLNSSTTTMINATNGAKVCVKTGSC